MDYPGKNRLKLSEAATIKMIEGHVCTMLGRSVRVTMVSMPSYGGDATIDFTSDPLPDVPPEPGSAETVAGIIRSAGMPMAEDPL